MKNAFSKGVLRSITHSLGRFLAIAVIAALGTGFYAGLRMTSTDMRLAADQYFDATHMADLRVVSTLGLSDESLDMLRDVEGVEDVMPAREVDVLATVEDVQYTMRVQSFDAAAARASDTSDGVHAVSDDDHISTAILVPGSWPEGPTNACSWPMWSWTVRCAAGDTVTVLEGTQDVDETLSTREYTVTGFVAARTTFRRQAWGRHRLAAVLLTRSCSWDNEGFASDTPYTEAFISVAGAAFDEAAGSDAYQAKVDEVAQRIEECGLAAARLDEVKSEAQKELDQKRADYETQKADAESTARRRQDRA